MTDTRQIAACCAWSVDTAETVPALRQWWRDHTKAMAVLSEAQVAWLTARAQRRAKELGNG